MTKLEQLKAAFEASTQGRWKLLAPGAPDGVGECRPFGAVVPAPHRIISAEGRTAAEAEANTEFIALAHNLMPHLLEAAELVTRACSLIAEAMDTHIYNEADGEGPDADCEYLGFLNDTKTLLEKLK